MHQDLYFVQLRQIHQLAVTVGTFIFLDMFLITYHIRTAVLPDLARVFIVF
jgi:hypothetical protein